MHRTLVRTDSELTPIAPVCIPILAFCVGALVCSPASGSQLLVAGGGLHVNGTLTVDTITIETGTTLSGNGNVTGQAAVRGTIAPGIGALYFGSSVAMLPGSVFACYAASHTDLTRISAVGAVTGSAQVMMSKAVGAIPISQAIVNGGSGSSYALFSLAGSDPQNWQLMSPNGRDLLVTDLAGDSNGNGVADWWELAYFGGRTNCIPGADSDGDGSSDSDEFVAGTNPTNSNSSLRVSAMNRSGASGMVLSWSSVSNRQYFIERADNLALGFSDIVASDIQATPPVNMHTNETGGVSVRFYRVGVQ